MKLLRPRYLCVRITCIRKNWSEHNKCNLRKVTLSRLTRWKSRRLHLSSQMGIGRSCARRHFAPDHKVTHFLALITRRYNRDFLSKLLRDDASIPRGGLASLSPEIHETSREGWDQEGIASLWSRMSSGDELGRKKAKWNKYMNDDVIVVELHCDHAIRAVSACIVRAKGWICSPRSRPRSPDSDGTGGERRTKWKKKTRKRKRKARKISLKGSQTAN